MQKKKAPFTTEENIEIGTVETSESKGMKIALVTKDGRHYISITKVYKTKKENKWNPQGGIWLPFDSAKDIMEEVYRAYETGMKLEWIDREE